MSMRNCLKTPAIAMVSMAIASAAVHGEDASQHDAAAHQENGSLTDVRAELEQLKRVNQQMARRIQVLEAHLGSGNPAQAASPSAESTNVGSVPSGDAIASSGQPKRTDVTADAPVRKSPGASRGVEDLLLEEHTFFDQKFSAELGFEYAHFDRSQLVLNGFLALDAIFLGDIGIDEVAADIFTTSLTGRWTVNDRLQLSMSAPFVYRETTTRSGGQELSSILKSEKTVDDNDLGDVSLGVSYRLFAETPAYPDIVWTTSVIAPTGRSPYGIDFVEDPRNTNLSYPKRLPTGSGLWGVQTGLSFLKTVDPAILFASVSWRHYIQDHFNDLSSDPKSAAAPGDVTLGDQYQFAAGMAFALNERLSFSTAFTQRFIAATRIARDGQPTKSVVGSETSSGTFDVGVTYALNDNMSLVTDLGVGLTNDASDYTFSLKLPYRF